VLTARSQGRSRRAAQGRFDLFAKPFRNGRLGEPDGRTRRLGSFRIATAESQLGRGRSIAELIVIVTEGPGRPPGRRNRPMTWRATSLPEIGLEALRTRPRHDGKRPSEADRPCSLLGRLNTAAWLPARPEAEDHNPPADRRANSICGIAGKDRRRKKPPRTIQPRSRAAALCDRMYVAAANARSA
jgi:hypothetical protein